MTWRGVRKQSLRSTAAALEAYGGAVFRTFFLLSLVRSETGSALWVNPLASTSASARQPLQAKRAAVPRRCALPCRIPLRRAFADLSEVLGMIEPCPRNGAGKTFRGIRPFRDGASQKQRAAGLANPNRSHHPNHLLGVTKWTLRPMYRIPATKALCEPLSRLFRLLGLSCVLDVQTVT